MRINTIISFIMGILTSFIGTYLYDKFKKKRSETKSEKNSKEKIWFWLSLLIVGVILYFVITGIAIIFFSDITDFSTFRKSMFSIYNQVGVLTMVFWILIPAYLFTKSHLFFSFIHSPGTAAIITVSLLKIPCTIGISY